ncbi:unnamed protein product [Protopolystoma xenopodis]|uniref:Ig-like domain-containing protein n=1 Tax=Protopolystoma xenopodis TaxID=117903 RepID=A0A448WUG4_9PLAT|nr:unnamed protein product [Protopolystoma xenopodis]
MPVYFVPSVLLGESINLDLEPLGNPKILRYQWRRNGKPLPTVLTADSGTNLVRLESSSATEASGPTPRLRSQESRLVIDNVQADDMSNYTLVVENKLGAGQFTFFLNVTRELLVVFTGYHPPFKTMYMIRCNTVTLVTS